MTNKSPRLFHLVVTSSSSYETHCLRHPQAESSDSLVITVRSIVVILTHTTSSESAQNLIGHHDLVDALPRFGRISISVWRSRGGAHPFTYFGFGGAAVEEERRTPTPGDDPFTSPPPPLAACRRIHQPYPPLAERWRPLARAPFSPPALMQLVWWWCGGAARTSHERDGGVKVAVWGEMVVAVWRRRCGESDGGAEARQVTGL